MADEDSEIAFKQLEQYYDYTKWHVGLYAGGVAGAWLLKDGAAAGEWWWWQAVGTGLFIAAGACAGAICGTIPECKTLAELNNRRISILQFKEREWFPRGVHIRCAEKVCFWGAVFCVVKFLLCSPEKPKQPPAACCVCSALAAPSSEAGLQQQAKSLAAGSRVADAPGMNHSKTGASRSKADAGTR